MAVSLANLSWPQRTALALGVLLAVWGLVDLVSGRAPLGVLHALTGLVVAAAAFRVRVLRWVGTGLGLLYLVVFALGSADGVLDAGIVGNGVHLLLGFGFVALTESCVWCEQRARLREERLGRLS